MEERHDREPAAEDERARLGEEQQDLEETYSSAVRIAWSPPERRNSMS
jgi:hypothetical protein